jgi:hypothetical protein
MKVSTLPAGAPRGRIRPRPKSRTALITASSADVARRSCSSAPLIPDVGINLAACQDESAGCSRLEDDVVVVIVEPPNRGLPAGCYRRLWGSCYWRGVEELVRPRRATTSTASPLARLHPQSGSPTRCGGSHPTSFASCLNRDRPEHLAPSRWSEHGARGVAERGATWPKMLQRSCSDLLSFASPASGSSWTTLGVKAPQIQILSSRQGCQRQADLELIQVSEPFSLRGLRRC